MTQRAGSAARHLSIEIDDPTDAQARAAVLAVIAIRLARYSAESDVPASPTGDLIYAAARHVRRTLKLLEHEIAELLASASAVAARSAFLDDSGTDAADQDPTHTKH